MGLFSRFKKNHVSGSAGPAFDARRRDATRAHLAEFASNRRGVEAYFEPGTPREQPALLLVARDGEWTRRRVPGLKEAADLSQSIGLPFYEVVKTGYPDAMRKWNERQRDTFHQRG